MSERQRLNGEPEPPTQPMTTTGNDPTMRLLPSPGAGAAGAAAAGQPVDPPTAEAPTAARQPDPAEAVTVRGVATPATAVTAAATLPQQHNPRVPRPARPGMMVGGRHIDWTTAALALATALVLGVLLTALLLRPAGSQDQQAEPGSAGAPGSVLQAPETVGVGAQQQAPGTTDTSVGGGQASPSYSGGSDAQTGDRSGSSEQSDERDAAPQPHEADERDRRDRNEGRGKDKDPDKADKERDKRQDEQEREREKRDAEREREREKRDAEREREREKRDQEQGRN